MSKFLIPSLFSIALLTTHSGFAGFSFFSFLALFAVFVLLVLQVLTGKILLVRKDFVVLAVALIWLITPFLFSASYVSIENNFKYIVLYLLYVIVSHLFVRYLIANRGMDRFVIVFALFYSIINTMLLVAFVYKPETFAEVYSSNQFSGVYNNRNILALHTVFIMALYFFIVKNRARAVTSILLLSLLSFLAVSTGSSKGLVGILLVLLFYFAFYFYKKSIYKYLMLILIGLSLASTSQFFDNSFERMNKHLAFFVDTGHERSISSLEREWLFISGFELGAENLWKGVGLNNTQYYLYTPYRIKSGECGFKCGGTYTHNNYIEVFSSAGIFSWALFYIPLFFIWFVSFFKSLWLVCRKIMHNSPVNSRVPFALLSITTLILLLDFGFVSYENLFKTFMYVLILNLFFFRSCFVVRSAQP